MGESQPGVRHGQGTTYVVVSGVPGAGKSTVASALARTLGLPLLAMDPVKEALWDRLGGGDVERSRHLGRAANEVVFGVASRAPSVVLDSFWRHEWAPNRLAELPGEIVEVFCHCPADEARRRYGSRQRHPAHLDSIRVRDPDPWAPHRTRPLRGDCITIDTSGPVDVEALAAEVRAHARWDGRARHRAPVLVVMAGLPGTGKTAIAEALSEATGAPVFGRDIVGAALSRVDATPPGDPDGVAFELLGVMAAEQLAVGCGVILDTVGGRLSTRRTWKEIASDHGVPIVVIECTCSDDRVHRERLAGRRRGIPGWYEVMWDGVEAVRARYEAWDEERAVLDAVEPLQANIAAAIEYVDVAIERHGSE